jgi:hypothetical protein
VLAPDGDHFSLSRTFSLVRRLDKLWRREAKRVEGRPAELVAVHRAMMTVILVAMEGANDSCGVLGDVFSEVITAYAETDWNSAGIAPDAFFCDAIEFAVWEDYGLTDELEAFFTRAEPAPAGVIEGILGEVDAELREHGTFAYQLEKLGVMRANFLVAYRRFDEFPALAAELGPHQWGPIVAMATAAWKARKRDLALAVFTAANRPGTPRLPPAGVRQDHGARAGSGTAPSRGEVAGPARTRGYDRLTLGTRPGALGYVRHRGTLHPMRVARHADRDAGRRARHRMLAGRLGCEDLGERVEVAEEPRLLRHHELLGAAAPHAIDVER